MMENTSESSMTPCLMFSQFLPPSAVFQGKCQVPTYSMSGLAGSTASDSTSCSSLLPGGVIWLQVAPASLERNTPCNVPANSVLGLDGDCVNARIDWP